HEDSLNASVRASSRDAGELVTVLEAVQTYLAKTGTPRACPVCESEERAADLADQVRRRLAALASVQSAQSKAAAAQLTLQRAEQQLEMVRKEARTEVTRFEEILSEFTAPPDVRLPARPIPTTLTGLSGWLKESMDMPAHWKVAEVQRHDRKQFIAT